MGWPLAASAGSIDTGPPHPRATGRPATRGTVAQPAVLILRVADAGPAPTRPRRRPRNGTGRGGLAGRGFSTTLSPHLSTPRQGRWTVSRSRPKPVDAPRSGAGIL